MSWRGLAVAGVVAVAIGAGCASGARDGRAIYHAACATCHGVDGSGDTLMGRRSGAKDLARPEARRLSDAAIRQQIVAGSGQMPAFGSLLSEAELAAVTAYVRRLGR